MTTQAQERRSAPDLAGAAPDVSLAGIRKAYGDVVAVEHVDLEIARGEFFTMLGPSGSARPRRCG